MKNLIVTVYIKKEKNRLKADGSAPVYFKIKVNNTISYLSANVSVNPERWEHTDKFTKRKMDLNEKEVSIYLNSQVKELNKIEDDFIEKNISYTAEMIKNRILGRDCESLYKNKTISDAFQYHKEYFMDLAVKGEREKASYKKYRSLEKHLTDFVKKKYNQNEYLLSNIDNAFQKSFHTYLSGLPKLTAKNSVIKYIILFRCVIQLLTDEGWLKKYPLIDYEMQREPTNPTALTLDEVRLLINKNFEDEKLNRIKDYYLFVCMTGLSYIDLISLETSHINRLGSDMILSKQRVKTKKRMNTVATVLLQPEAIDILDKYAGQNNNNPERCFPYISNKEYNIYIKVVAKLVGITKNLTTHTARHTMGCLMVLKGVDPKARQLAMGHSRPNQTDLYARMFTPQVVEEQTKMDGTFAPNPSKEHLKKAV